MCEILFKQNGIEIEFENEREYLPYRQISGVVLNFNGRLKIYGLHPELTLSFKMPPDQAEDKYLRLMNILGL